MATHDQAPEPFVVKPGTVWGGISRVGGGQIGLGSEGSSAPEHSLSGVVMLTLEIRTQVGHRVTSGDPTSQLTVLIPPANLISVLPDLLAAALAGAQFDRSGDAS